jgi:hypothetical protein
LIGLSVFVIHVLRYGTVGDLGGISQTIFLGNLGLWEGYETLV